MSNETCDSEGFFIENIVISSSNEDNVLGVVNVDKIRDKLPVVRFNERVFAEVTLHNVLTGIVSPCIKQA